MVRRVTATIPFLLISLLSSQCSWGTRKELLPILLLGLYLLFRAIECFVPCASPPGSLALGSCLLGFVWGAPTRPPTIPSFAGAFVTVEGELSAFYTFPGIRQENQDKRKWLLTRGHIAGQDTSIPRISATIRGDENLEVGDQVRVFGWLEYKNSKWNLRSRFLAFGAQNSLDPGRIGAEWRRRLRTRVESRYQGFPSRVIQSLVLGRKNLRPEETETIRQAGVSHLFAVSGLHLILICGVLSFLLKMAGLRDPWLGLATLMGATGFAILTGFKPPMTRALLGFALFTLAKTTRRPVHSGWCLLIVATFELLRVPQLARSISFQLSFAAVAGILWLGPRHQGRKTRTALKAFLIRKKKAGHGRKLIDGIILTSAAIVATAPFTLFHFGTFTPIALLSNLAILPLLTITLIAGLLELFVSLPTFILNWLCETMLISMEGASQVNFGHIETSKPPVWAYIPFLVGLVLAWHQREQSQLKSQMIAWIAVFFLLFSTRTVKEEPQLRFTKNPQRFDIAFGEEVSQLKAEGSWKPGLEDFFVAGDTSTSYHMEVLQSQGILAKGLWGGATFINFGSMSFESCLTYCRWNKQPVDILILPQGGADVDATLLLTGHLEPKIVVCHRANEESFMAVQRRGYQVMDYRTFNRQFPSGKPQD